MPYCCINSFITRHLVPLSIDRIEESARTPVALNARTRYQVLTLLEPQSRFGDKPLKLQVVCPQNGTAVL